MMPYHEDKHRRRSRGSRPDDDRTPRFVKCMICLLSLVAFVNVCVGLLQFGGIGKLNQRLQNVERLAVASGDSGTAPAPAALNERRTADALNRMQAWTVSVFPLPGRKVSLDQVEKNAVAAGTFMHAGSWISLNEFDKHEGLLVPESVALNIRGTFLPADTSNYVFRLDLRFEGDLKTDGRSTVLACYGRFGTKRRPTVLSGKILFHAKQNTSRHRTLLARVPVPMKGLNPYRLSTTVYCNLPQTVRPADVMFRLSVRSAADAVFQPVKSELWTAESVPEPASRAVRPSDLEPGIGPGERASEKFPGKMI